MIWLYLDADLFTEPYQLVITEGEMSMTEKNTADIDPDTGWSRAVARQIERSVRIAGPKTDSWAIMDGHPGVHVNIGQRNAIEMDDHYVRLLIDIKYFSLDKLSPTTRCLDWRDNNEDKSPRLRKVEFSVMKAVRELRRMRTGHEMAVRLVSDKKTPFREQHVESLTAQLERIAGLSFPRPGH